MRVLETTQNGQHRSTTIELDIAATCTLQIYNELELKGDF